MRRSKALSGIWRVRIRSEMSAWGSRRTHGQVRSSRPRLVFFGESSVGLLLGGPGGSEAPSLPSACLCCRLPAGFGQRLPGGCAARALPTAPLRALCGQNTAPGNRRPRSPWAGGGSAAPSAGVLVVSMPERPYLTRDTSQPWLALALRPPASGTRGPLLLQPLTPGARRLGLCNASSWERRVPEASARLRQRPRWIDVVSPSSSHRSQIPNETHTSAPASASRTGLAQPDCFHFAILKRFWKTKRVGKSIAFDDYVMNSC